MRLKFLIYLSILFSTNLVAQFSITGKVSNNENLPIEFCEILVYKNDSIISSSYSDEIGNFIIENLKQDIYIISANHFNEEFYKDTILINENIDLPIYYNNIDLNIVTIKSKKKIIERKIDRIIYNPSLNPSNGGGGLIDILENTPRIKIKDENIYMTGKSTIKVMINNKMLTISGNELFNYLSSISSEQVKNIEIITNPPSDYEASGNSGIINIILKKPEENSFNGNLQLRDVIRKYNLHTYGGAFNFKKNRFMFQSMLSKTDGKTFENTKSNLIYTDKIVNENFESINSINNLLGNISLDYNISDKFQTGLEFNYTTNKSESKNTINTNLYDKSNLNNVFLSKGNPSKNSKYYTLNYHLIYSIDTIGRKLTIDADYVNLKNKNVQKVENFMENNEPFSINDNSGSYKADNLSFNINMIHPLESVNLQYGARFSKVETFNDNTDELHIVNTNDVSNIVNKFNTKENIYSAFISAHKNWSEKFSSKLGLRSEYTFNSLYSISNKTDNTKKYLDLFPTLYLLYEIDNSNSMSLSFGKRIYRPKFSNLNPFRVYYSPYSYSEGNPDLKPSYSYDFELEYSYKDFSVTNLYYSYLKNDYNQIVIAIPETNTQALIPLNYANGYNIGLNQINNYSPFNFWSINSEMNVFYSNYKGTIPEVDYNMSGWNAEFTIGNIFSVGKKKSLMFNIDYTYTSRGINRIDENSSYHNTTIGSQILLMNKQLKFNLLFNNVFNNSNPTYTSISNNVKNLYKTKPIPYLRFSVTYLFGRKFKVLTSKSENEIKRLQ